MVRGTGKFKQKRGGGRSFSKNLELDENGTAVSTDKKWAPRDKLNEDDESEEEESDEESSEEEPDEPTPAAGTSAEPEMTRAERREMKKKGGPKAKVQAGDEEELDEDLVNPNHVAQKMKGISDLGGTRELSRREREQKDKADAKDRYWKLHLAGKTDEAKSDLGRLAKIRQEREEAQAKRKAEAEAKAAEAEAKKQAQKTGKRPI